MKLKKMHLPEGNASFCSANPDPKNAYTFGRFFGLAKKSTYTFGRFFGVAKNAEKRVQECQDWNYPGPRLSSPESIWRLSKVDLSLYLCIFLFFYLSIFLSIYLSIIYLSIYLWQFDYLLTFDGSKQAVGHQISQNAVNKCICIFVKFWEISSAWWNVTNPICSIPSWMHRLWFLDGSNHQKFQTRSVVFTGFLIEWHNI